MLISPPHSSRRTDAVAGIPLMRQVLLPSAVISRLSISASERSYPAFSRLFSTASGTCSKAARMTALDAPVRTRSFEVRLPRMALMESIRMDLPAPVSPVRTFRPGLKCTSAFWITATFSICRLLSIYSLPHYFCTMCRISSEQIVFASRSDRATIRNVSSPERVPTTFFHCSASKTSQAALAMPE